MRRSPCISSAALAVGLSLALTAGPAGAVSTCDAGAGKGDGRVRPAGGAFVGQATFGCDGDQQTVAEVLEPGDKAAFGVRFRNDSASTRAITVSGGMFPSEVKVRIVLKGNDVTKQVLGDGRRFKGVAPGASTPALRVKVEAPGGGPAELFLHLRGRSGGTTYFQADTVGVSVLVGPGG